MKKAVIILTVIALCVTASFGQSGTVQIFKSMLPEQQTAVDPISDVLALEIWNTIKLYPSPRAFVESNSGLYSPKDVRDVYLEAKDILTNHILPFISGEAVKEAATYDEETGEQLTPVVYWNPADKLAYRDYWRTAFGDLYKLDIVRIYLDWDASAFS